jgi:hypothetical protein
MMQHCGMGNRLQEQDWELTAAVQFADDIPSSIYLACRTYGRAIPWNCMYTYGMPSQLANSLPNRARSSRY